MPATSQSTPPDHYLWLLILLNGIFIALSVPTPSLAAFAGVQNENVSTARTIYYGARQFGASIGVTCATLLIDRRLTFHTARLLDSFINRNLGVVDMNEALAVSDAIHASIRKQAFVLAYADVFYVMAWIAFLTIFLTPLLPRMKRAAAATESASPASQSLSHEELA